MCEILGIIFLANLARDRGLSGFWAILGPGLGWMGAFLGVCFGSMVDPYGDMGTLLGFMGYIAGFASAFMIVSGQEGTKYDDFSDIGGSAECPACHSIQTEVVGGMIQCYACDEISPA